MRFVKRVKQNQNLKNNDTFFNIPATTEKRTNNDRKTKWELSILKWDVVIR
jgi:hypothetical protein